MERLDYLKYEICEQITESTNQLELRLIEQEQLFLKKKKEKKEGWILGILMCITLLIAGIMESI